MWFTDHLCFICFQQKNSAYTEQFAQVKQSVIPLSFSLISANKREKTVSAGGARTWPMQSAGDNSCVSAAPLCPLQAHVLYSSCHEAERAFVPLDNLCKQTKQEETTSLLL